MSDTISNNTSGGNPTTGQLNTGPRYEELLTEIERLRAAHNYLADKAVPGLRIEIERLRADRDSWRIAARSWEERTKRAEALRAPLERKPMNIAHRVLDDMPMSPRMYATLIMERLREGSIDLPLSDKEGYTVQDIITDHIERAISDALRAPEQKP